MKKIRPVIFSFLVLLSLTACGEKKAEIKETRALPPLTLDAGEDIITGRNELVILNGTIITNKSISELLPGWEAEGLIFDNRNLLNPTVTTPDAPGEYEITFEYYYIGQHYGDTVIITVTNNPPEITSILDNPYHTYPSDCHGYHGGDTVGFNVRANESEGDTLSYSWVNHPDNPAPLEEMSNQSFYGYQSTVPSEPGKYTVIASATDGYDSVSKEASFWVYSSTNFTDSISGVYAMNNDGNLAAVLDTEILKVYSVSNNTFTEVQSVSVPGYYSMEMSQDGSLIAIGNSYDPTMGSDSGCVSIYQLENNLYTKKTTIYPSVGLNQYFGVSISIREDNNLIAVGATGDNYFGKKSGAVYVFTNTGTEWNQTEVLRGISGKASQRDFGRSISLRGNTLLIGSPEDATMGEDSGAVYNYVLQDGAWTERETIFATPPMRDALFGNTIDLSSDGKSVIISAFGEEYNEGAAFYYTNNNGNWEYSKYFCFYYMRDTYNTDYLAWSTKISDDGNFVYLKAYGNNFSEEQYLYVYDISPDSGTYRPIARFASFKKDVSFNNIAMSGDGKNILFAGNFYRFK